MTLETAALLGMGAVLLFGIIALLFAFAAGKSNLNPKHKG